MRHIIPAIVALALVSSPCIAHANVARLIIEDVNVCRTISPMLLHARLFVPASVFKSVGMIVKNKSNREVSVEVLKSDLGWDFKAGRKWIPGQMAGSRINLLAAPFMHDNVLMVPFRDIANETGMQVKWDQKTKTAHVHLDKFWCWGGPNHPAK